MTTNSKKGLLRLAQAGFVSPRRVPQSGGCAACANAGNVLPCGKLRCLLHRAYVPKFGRCDVWTPAARARAA